jgi:hypothetical protein
VASSARRLTRCVHGARLSAAARFAAAGVEVPSDGDPQAVHEGETGFEAACAKACRAGSQGDEEERGGRREASERGGCEEDGEGQKACEEGHRETSDAQLDSRR